VAVRRLKNIMWIPKPVYDYAPSFWLFLGALFLAGAIYLDLPDGLGAAYYMFAIFCVGHAIWTLVARRRSRQQRSLHGDEEAPRPAKDSDT
jgi:hypothetical protein